MHAVGSAKIQPINANVPCTSTPFAQLLVIARLTRCDVGLVDRVPDDVLLEIFDFCGDEKDITIIQSRSTIRSTKRFQAWRTLVHVCRRWRSIVFKSPRRLDLRLLCTHRTPARDTLDGWPPLPLVILCDQSIECVDNIVAALERSNRVCRITLSNVSSWELEKLWAAMQEPFPELTDLELSSYDETVAVLPSSFLGGSAPRLRELYFRGIPVPGLPKLLLSTTHLVILSLNHIPHSGYFSPEAMAAALSTLTSLGSLLLAFQSPRSCPHPASRHQPPPTRFALPVLRSFSFRGVGEYLDDLVAHIDAPQLNKLDITFFNQIVFGTPQFIVFVSRTPTLAPLERANVVFRNGAVRVNLSSRTTRQLDGLNMRILCRELDWQVSSMEQVCTWCLPPLPMLKDLYISELPKWQPNWKDNMDNTQWLELLHPFRAVKNLYLSEKFARRIVPALQELAGGVTTEVLPILQNIFLERYQPSGPVQEGIRQFSATRLVNNPIAVSRWE